MKCTDRVNTLILPAPLISKQKLRHRLTLVIFSTNTERRGREMSRLAPYLGGPGFESWFRDY